MDQVVSLVVSAPQPSERETLARRAADDHLDPSKLPQLAFVEPQDFVDVMRTDRQPLRPVEVLLGVNKIMPKGGERPLVFLQRKQARPSREVQAEGKPPAASK